MFMANDLNGQRVDIEDALNNGEELYTCPSCNKQVFRKKGNGGKAPHFSHYPNQRCTDTWEYDNSREQYELCKQIPLPSNNREIKVSNGETTHRADFLISHKAVLVKRQDITKAHFKERNEFFYNAGCCVVWLVDLTQKIANEKIQIFGNVIGKIKWITDTDLDNGYIEIFLKIKAGDEKSIVKVVKTNYDNHVWFDPNYIGVAEFLKHIGYENERCAEPDEDLESRKRKQVYSINSYKEQKAHEEEEQRKKIERRQKELEEKRKQK